MGFVIVLFAMVNIGLLVLGAAFTDAYSSGESGNDSTSIYIGSNNDNGE